MTYKPKTKVWFIRRIGKRIFRDGHKCCAVCDAVAKNGLVIFNESHADYLAMTDSEFAHEKIYLNYRDEK